MSCSIYDKMDRMADAVTGKHESKQSNIIIGLRQNYRKTLVCGPRLRSRAAGLDGMRRNKMVAYLMHFRINAGLWFHEVA